MLIDRPIADEELAGIFRPTVIPELIVLAVSGGADSMAMMHLFATYRRLALSSSPCKSSKAIVATVDHGLRAGSDAEARFVCEQALQLGFDHVTLPWVGDKPDRGLQNAAREARYGLLNTLVAEQELKPAFIVVAHHRDDQVETVLMRFGRGSGVEGLRGMRREAPSMFCKDTSIWRPFLGIAKSRLIATLERDGVGWVEDPSNSNTDFERVRLRNTHSERDALGLSNEAVSRSASRLDRANVALSDIAQRAFELNVGQHTGAFCEIPAEFLLNESEEIVLRVVGRTIALMTGSQRAPNMSKLEDLIDAMRIAIMERSSGLTKTLNGCVISFEDGSPNATSSGAQGRTSRVLFLCEPGRADLRELELRPGGFEIWNRRFQTHLPDAAKTPLTVRAMSAHEFSKLRGEAEIITHIPHRAIATLPSFWDAERLICVPHLDYCVSGWQEPRGRIETVTRYRP